MNRNLFASKSLLIICSVILLSSKEILPHFSFSISVVALLKIHQTYSAAETKSLCCQTHNKNIKLNKNSSVLIISLTLSGMAFIRRTPNLWFSAFIISVNPSCWAICYTRQEYISSACSFRSVRYTFNLPKRNKLWYRDLLCCLI